MENKKLSYDSIIKCCFRLGDVMAALAAIIMIAVIIFRLCGKFTNKNNQPSNSADEVISEKEVSDKPKVEEKISIKKE